MPAIKSLMDEVMQPPSFDSAEDTGETLAREAEILAAVAKIGLFAAGVASQRYMTALQDQQEVMADLADIITQVFALESASAARPKTGGCEQELSGRGLRNDQSSGRREHGNGRTGCPARPGGLR